MLAHSHSPLGESEHVGYEYPCNQVVAVLGSSDPKEFRLDGGVCRAKQLKRFPSPTAAVSAGRSGRLRGQEPIRCEGLNRAERS